MKKGCSVGRCIQRNMIHIVVELSQAIRSWCLSASCLVLMVLLQYFILARAHAEAGKNKYLPDTSATPVLEESADVLANKRLFFDVSHRDGASDEKEAVDKHTVSEHIAADAQKASVEESSKNSSQVRDSAENVSYQPYVDTSIAESGLPDIRYEARIVYEETIRIIVNSRPCHTVSIEPLLSKVKGTKIRCDGLKTARIEIFLLSDKHRIKVVRQQEELGILSPGQRL